MRLGRRIAAVGCSVALLGAAVLAVNTTIDGTAAANSVSESVVPPPATESPVANASKEGAAAEVPKPTPTSKSIPKATGTAYLTVPSAGIDELEIVPYVGDPDDARGTEINDEGLAGAPRGDWGGVAPGQVGNLMLTAHRTSAGAPMQDLPNVKVGDRIYVDQGSFRFVYVANKQVTINFRSEESRAKQVAAVPGFPGRAATRPAIVLSTCATPEDHAEGNYWRDQFDNPTHRIAVYGFLESVQPRG